MRVISVKEAEHRFELFEAWFAEYRSLHRKELWSMRDAFYEGYNAALKSQELATGERK